MEPKVLRPNNYGVIQDLEIVRVGEYHGGQTKVTRQNLQEWVDDFQKTKAETQHLPTVFVGHNDGYSEKPAIAFLDNLRLIGNSIYADIIGTVQDFLDLRQQYPYQSIEAMGERLTGMAFLGSNAPAVPTAPIFMQNEKSGEKCVIIACGLHQLITNSQDMEIFKKMLVKLQAKETISQAELDLVKLTAEDLTEEEQAEVKEELETLETKLETTEEEVEETAEVVEETAEEVSLQALKNKDQEMRKLQAELDKMKAVTLKAQIDDEIKEKFILSETVDVGLNQEGAKALSNFAMKLSDSMREELFSAISQFKYVDGKTYGVSGKSIALSEDTEIKETDSPAVKAQKYTAIQLK